MYLPDVELHHAATLDEAVALLARHGPSASLLAGGTDLLVDLKTGRVSARHLISLRRIDKLRGITRTHAGLDIGALTTIAEIERSALVGQGYPAILDAASRMAARQIRNLATVGGNVTCGVPCADLPPILTAMNASLRLCSPFGQREVPLGTFHTGARETILRDNEVLKAIHVPLPPLRFGAAYARFAQRDGNAIAVAGVAASLLLAPDGTVREGLVVLNAVAPTPKTVRAAGEALAGKPPEPEAFRAAAAAAQAAAEPISDVRGSADFRRELVGVLTRRALERALVRVGEARP